MWQRYKKAIVPIAVLFFAIVIFAILKATKPQAPLKEVQERYWPVAVQAVSFQDVQPFLNSFGEVRAGRDAELRAQVSGSVTAIHERLGDGAFVHEGEVLVKIDDFDYVATLQEKQADLSEAQAKLGELETVLDGEEKLLPGDEEQVKIATRELERQRQLLKRSAVSKKAYDDAQAAYNDRRQNVLVREQAIARLKTQVIQARSGVEKAQTALSKAERDVQDTELKAPFDGFLSETDVTAGKQVSTSDRLGRLISLQNLEVRFHLSEAAFAHLTKSGPLQRNKVRVIVPLGGKNKEYTATINRMDARVDATTGGRKIFATFADLLSDTPLRPGLFVKVLIPDQTYEKVVRLPANAVFEENHVYLVEEGRLKKRPVQIEGRDGDFYLVHDGLNEGEKVLTTRFAEVGEGILVKVIQP